MGRARPDISMALTWGGKRHCLYIYRVPEQIEDTKRNGFSDMHKHMMLHNYLMFFPRFFCNMG